MPKLIIFDMDGLLINSEPMWWQAYREVFGRLRVDLSDERLRQNAGRRVNENVDLLYKEYKWDGPSPRVIQDKIVRRVKELIAQSGSLMPGVDHVISVCKQADLPMAIASSSDLAIIETVVDKLKIRENFKHIYSAQYEPHGKPHPGVFITVAKHFKTGSEDCLVFEDSPAGVIAAKSAKMKCVAVPSKANQTNPIIKIADIVLKSLEDFTPQMLASL